MQVPLEMVPVSPRRFAKTVWQKAVIAPVQAPAAPLNQLVSTTVADVIAPTHGAFSNCHGG
jgi:hypothetical protein